MRSYFKALDELIKSLQTAPAEDKERGQTLERGNIKTIITPQDPSLSDLGPIIVYGHPDSDTHARVYTILSLNLSVGCSHRIGLNGQARDSRYNNPLHSFVSSLGGDEVEVDTSKLSLDLAKSNFYWDSRWKDIGLVGSEYTQEIYPKVLSVLINRLYASDATDVHFVDLFGGDGEFVKRLQSKLGQLNGSVSFHIIDASSASLDRARELLKEDENVFVHPPRYIQPDEKIFQGVPKPPQFVTAIGGICNGVVSRQEALGITQMVYKEMAEDGIFLVTGRTSVLLNAEDFSGIGFRVRQMTIPENVVYFRSPFQLYILKK